MPQANSKEHVLALISARREQRSKRPHAIPRIPKFREPKRLIATMHSALMRYVRDIGEIFDEVLPDAEIERLVREAGVRDDAIRTDGPEEIVRMVELLKLRTNRAFESYSWDSMLRNMAEGVSDWHSEWWQSSLRKAFGLDIFQIEPWLDPLTTVWVNENSALIQSLAERAIEDTRRILNTGIRDGDSWQTIRDGIRKVSKNTPERRAEVIARDQIGSLNGQINEQRQTRLGIREYIWRNSNDERVRGNPGGFYPNSRFNHWNREEQRFEWGKPPKDGNPGMPILCRCYAEPVFPPAMMRAAGLREGD